MVRVENAKKAFLGEFEKPFVLKLRNYEATINLASVKVAEEYIDSRKASELAERFGLSLVMLKNGDKTWFIFSPKDIKSLGEISTKCDISLKQWIRKNFVKFLIMLNYVCSTIR